MIPPSVAEELFWLRYTLGITAKEADDMPAWELNILLQQLNEFLPHILYGVEGAQAVEKRKTSSAAVWSELPSQPVGS